MSKMMTTNKTIQVEIGQRVFNTGALHSETDFSGGYYTGTTLTFKTPATIQDWQDMQGELDKGAQWVLLKWKDSEEYFHCLVVARQFQSGIWIGDQPQQVLSMELRGIPRPVMGPEPMRRDSRGRWASRHRPLQNKRLYRYDVCEYLRERGWTGSKPCCGSCHCDEGMHSMEDFEADYPGRLDRYIQLGICHPLHNYMKANPLTREQWAHLIKDLRKEDRDVKKS